MSLKNATNAKAPAGWGRLTWASLACALAGALSAWVLTQTASPLSPNIVRRESLVLLGIVFLLGTGPAMGALLAVLALRRIARLSAPPKLARAARIALILLFPAALGALFLCVNLWQARRSVMRARCVWNLGAHEQALDLWKTEQRIPGPTPKELSQLSKYWKEPPGYYFGHCPSWPWPAYRIAEVGEEVHCPVHGSIHVAK